MKNTLLAASLSLLLTAAPVLAQDPGHPRENEVNNRLQDQQERVDKNVADGKISPRQAARDTTRDAKVAHEESHDEAKNGGHLTKAEQAKMNKQLNHNSADIKDQRDK